MILEVTPDLLDTLGNGIRPPMSLGMCGCSAGMGLSCARRPRESASGSASAPGSASALPTPLTPQRVALTGKASHDWTALGPLCTEP